MRRRRMGEYVEDLDVGDGATTFPAIIVIMGPTAVGKSAVALELAARFGADILSADSRQVYRHLDIGTAKPTIAERATVPHHLIDLVEPDESYSTALFRRDADRVLQGLSRKDRVAFLVGGSPHYLQAVVERLQIPPVPPQPAFRDEMEQLVREQGPEALHRRLRDADPAAADEIAGTNVRRVIRALEVIQATGRPFSEVGRKRGEPLRALKLAITADRSTLYRRIDDRVEEQIRAGLIEEARRVLEMGFEPTAAPLAGLVYREAIAVVRGEMSEKQGARRMKETTHAFARRQYTWFRRDPTLRWFELGPRTANEMADAIGRYLSSEWRMANGE